METLDAIRKRCSLKGQISQRDVERKKVGRILDAARLAPSTRNLQPWRFVVVRGRVAVESIVDAAFMPQNQVVRQAPVIIVACARAGDDMEREGKEHYLFDVGLAVENMLLAATDLGLVTHIMTGFDEQELRKALRIPDDVRVVAVTPVAYPAAGSYDDAAKARLSQRTRKGLGEVVYFNERGEQEPA